MYQLGRQWRKSPSLHICVRLKEKYLACPRITSWLFLFPDQRYKAGGSKIEENLLASAKAELSQSCWSSQGSELLRQQIASLCFRAAIKIKVRIKEDRVSKGITPWRRAAGNSSRETLVSFYEQQIACVRRHETLFTAAKAEYLTKNLKNEQHPANTCPTNQLSGTPRFGDKHGTLQDTLKGLVLLSV